MAIRVVKARTLLTNTPGLLSRSRRGPDLKVLGDEQPSHHPAQLLVSERLFNRRNAAVRVTAEGDPLIFFAGRVVSSPTSRISVAVD